MKFWYQALLSVEVDQGVLTHLVSSDNIIDSLLGLLECMDFWLCEMLGLSWLFALDLN